MSRPITTTLSLQKMNSEQDNDSLEDHPLFTPDLEYFTPPTNLNLNSTNGYISRTLTSTTMERQNILPNFPLYHKNDRQSNILLLCNVPKQELNELQLACREPDAFLSTFQLIETNIEIMNITSISFMISMYRQLLFNLSLKWKISIPILDYNLARLHQCTKKCLEQLQQQRRQENLQLFSSLPITATFSIEELPIALEFYLQIDVDLFYFKTCSFRQAQPIEETIFCSKLPAIQYSLMACNKSHCTCCHSGRKDAIQFNVKEKYEFLNGYQTILNCPATCESTNIICTLKCPCNKFEYIDYTNLSFRDYLTLHRNESNRIMCEFMFGPKVTQHLFQGIKSEVQRKNDRMWLYQHTARCSTAIQLFLDANPAYWCLIPMSNEEIQLRINTMIPPSYQTRQIDVEAKYLVQNIPDPPASFTFTDRQKYAQIQFISKIKNQLQSSPSSFKTNVDLYNATIIALLPENASEMLQQLILSLFITHTNCNLNQTGRLIQQPAVLHPYAARGNWCANLKRRPLSSLP